VGIEHAIAASYVAFLWWFSTAAILRADRLPPRTFPITLGGATVLLALGLAGILASRDNATPAGNYAAFGSALLVWAWAETAFLLGYVTGPRTTSLSSSGWGRFAQAVATILWHEVATIGLLVVIAVLAADAANPLAFDTFALLWLLRVSAKLNLFLGVRNTGESLLPPHLGYLASYFARRRSNALMPVSLLAMAGAGGLMAIAAFDPGIRPHDSTALVMKATLLALAALEHVFMVLPLDLTRIFAWSATSPPR